MSNCEENHTHDHEFLGSTMHSELEEDSHSHRFAGVSGPAIKVKGGHVHVIKGRTDIYEGHFHEFTATSGLPIYAGNRRHIHPVQVITTEAEGHRHNIILATLIEDPISEED